MKKSRGTSEIDESVGCLLRIQTLYPQLTRKEQAIADYVLNHEDVVYQSITEFVARSDAGYGSVVRFCKRLGCAGFQDFKIRLAEDLAVRKASASAKASGTFLQSLVDETCSTIRHTAEMLSGKELDRAAKALAASQLVLTIGVGGSAAVASELEYRLTRFGLRAVAVADGHVQRIRAATLSKSDVIVLVSFSGSTKEILHAGEVARKAGATVVCLTNFSTSPVSSIADIKLVTAVRVDPMGAEVVSNLATDFVLEALFQRLSEVLPQAQETVARTFQAVADRQL